MSARTLDQALARIAELESALQVLGGFTPDDNEWMRRAQEAEANYQGAMSDLLDAETEIRHLKRLRHEALNDLAAERKLREMGNKGLASPPPPPQSKSDAVDALRYLMEANLIRPNQDALMTVYGIDLSEITGIFTKNVRS